MDTVLFWIIAVSLTAIVTLTVLWPILRKREAVAPSRAEYDVEVFGAQLAEMTADVARGAIAAEDAAIARAEIGRRLLKADARAQAAKTERQTLSRKASIAALVFVALALPVASVGLYQSFGSPALPDFPLRARLAVEPGQADLPTLVAQAEARLRTNPDDGAGWDMLAPIYLRSGRPEEAAAALGNAIRLLGATPERETRLGEAQVLAASGEVTDVARASFERALRLDPRYLPAKFFLALDLSQENRFADAGRAWQELIDVSPDGAPWLELARRGVDEANRQLASAGAGATPADGAAGATPGAADGDAMPEHDMSAMSGEMAGGDQQAMIEGMVSQLATRLKTAPNDVEGWKRLLQSYRVLGDAERAESALAQATAAFPAGSPERGEIVTFAAGLGLVAGKETTTQ